MYTPRELLAVVLVVVIGVAVLVRPSIVLRLQFFSHGPTTGHRGEYGGKREFSDRALLAARAIGVVALGLGALILAQPYL